MTIEDVNEKREAFVKSVLDKLAAKGIVLTILERIDLETRSWLYVARLLRMKRKK